MTIVITVYPEKFNTTGNSWFPHSVEYNGQKFVSSGTGEVNECARWLIAQGCPDEDWITVDVDGKVRMIGKSILKSSKKSLVDKSEQSRTPHCREYVPFSI